MTLAEEKEKFKSAVKLILKDKLSKNIETLKGYRIKIIERYNGLIRYCAGKYKLVNEEKQQAILTACENAKDKLEECLIRLNCVYELSEETFDELDEENISEPRITESSDTETASEADAIEGNNSELDQETNQVEMSVAMTSAEFLRMASGHLNKSYSGDPMALTSFTDSVRLLLTLATSNELKAFLAQFVKTKIDGRAREFISAQDNTVERIIAALETNIRPDNSKVICGRILSLKLSNSNQEDFATKAEELAEAFRRSLVVEGVTHVKATEMAVDKTVELCRANARSELVKSVLEATAFTTPKDVIAKLLTQIDKAKQESQILAYQKMTDRNKNSGQNSSQNYGNHKGRGNRGQRGGNHSRGGHNNYNNGYHNNGGYQNNQNRRGGSHHRGNSRGGYRGNHNNSNGYQNGQSNVRVVYQSGNGEEAQQVQMGASNNNQYQ